MPKIEKMYAFIIEDEPGSEGITAWKFGNAWMPLVGADMKRIESLRPTAQNIADVEGQEIFIVEFSVKKIIDIIKPRNH